MRCENYTIKMNLKEEEITIMLTALSGYKNVVCPHSKKILESIEQSVRYQIAKQDREADKKVVDKR